MTTDDLVPTEAEKRVIEAAAKGERADFRTGDTQADDPARGEAWGDERTVRAEVVHDLCLGARPDWPVHHKGVEILGARIVGTLDFAGATLPCRLALGTCFLEEDINLLGAELPALSFSGSRIRALTADGLKARGGVFLRGTTAKGEVRFLGADIGGSLSCNGATFESPTATRNLEARAFGADGLKTTGSVFMRGTTAKGEVRFLGADIGGNLDCSGATFEQPAAAENPEAAALSADNIKTRGNVFFRTVTAKGEVRFLGAEIGGSLDCENGHFGNPAAADNPAAKAFGADGLKTRGDVILKDVTATGEVRLMGADIEGGLDCSGATFEHPAAAKNPEAAAFNADRLKTSGSVFLRGATTKGEMRLLCAEIGGTLSCDGAEFENPAAAQKAEAKAFHADRLKTRGSVFLRGTTAKGEVRFIGAEIGSDLSCNDCKFENPKGDAFNAERMIIERAFSWRGLRNQPNGIVDFAHARVGQLVDDAQSWPQCGKLILDGFEYEALAGDNTPTDAKARIQWLELAPPGRFWPQPYEQLVKVLRRMGHDRDAREIAIAKQEALRESGSLGRWGQAWNGFLGFTVGHGYRPWKALILMAAWMVFGAFVFGDAYLKDALMPTGEKAYLAMKESGEPPDGYPKFQPFAYSADLFIPVVDLLQERYWQPRWTERRGWGFVVYMWLHIAVGWVLTGVAVAGLTGVIKKD